MMAGDGERARARAILDAALERGERALDETQAKALLEIYGLSVPAGRVFTDASDAAAFARQVDGPVVLKLVDSILLHKSDGDLLSLNVAGDDRVTSEFHRLKAAAPNGEGRVLVEPMVRGAREFMIGMKRDETFGPIVIFGLGGIFAETLDDVCLAALPLGSGDALLLLDGIRARALCGPVRGLPSIDRGALAEAIEAVARIASDHDDISEIDINPIIIEGSQPVIADAIVIMDPSATSPESARTRPSRLDFEAIFSPQTVAVVGASDDLNKWGGRILANLIGGGFPGAVYPVNPRVSTVLGHPAYDSVGELPIVPDLAVIAVGSTRVQRVIEQCSEKGVRAAIVISSGFSETGKRGAQLEAAVSEHADDQALTLLGPNCMGVISTHDRLHSVGFLPLQPIVGGLSVVSQSGNIGIQLLMEAGHRGIGIAKYVTVGNEACISVTDVLEELGGDDRSEVILAYLEGVRDGRRFGEVLRRISATKPVILLRGGLTESGVRAAASHSGAMAGRSDVFLAVARQTGCVVCTDPDHGMDVALCLANLPPVRGPRVAIVTLGGGWGVLTADEVVRCGLSVVALAHDVIERLDNVLPEYWSHANPVDMVGEVDASIAHGVLEAVTRSDRVDAVLFMGALGSPMTGHSATTRAVQVPTNADKELLELVWGLMGLTQKPIICVPFCPIDLAMLRGEDDAAPVVLSSPATAVRALAAAAWYSAFRMRGDDVRSADPMTVTQTTPHTLAQMP